MNKSILHTPVCDMFGIKYPIFSAGIRGVVPPSGPELAAADVLRSIAAEAEEL
jgi:NAD(P)H-dependent flavin oxidoreductase YrpB (nitropropane dioxygenase family)